MSTNNPENLDGEGYFHGFLVEPIPREGGKKRGKPLPTSPVPDADPDWTLWKRMNVEQRALSAVRDLYLKIRENDNEQTARFLLEVACIAIESLGRSEHSRPLKHAAHEWPALVPAGRITGPLWKVWAKGIDAAGIGSSNKSVPIKGKADFGKSKPASLARACFLHLESLRTSDPLLYEIMEGANQSVPEYQKKALKLQPLSEQSVAEWRDLSLAYLENIDPDWVGWIKRWGGRTQTAQTYSNKKDDKGAQYQDGQQTRNGQPAQMDQGASRSVMANALREGLLAFLRSTQ